MLVEFRVENFLSFNEEVVFSTEASTDRLRLEDVTNKVPEGLGVDRLLTTSVVYGANASGKSNLVKAMKFVHYFVINSAPKGQAGDETGRIPFMLSDVRKKEPSKFEIVFIRDEQRFTYGFSVNEKHVIEEWLFVLNPGGRGNGKSVFQRQRDLETGKETFKFGPEWKKELSPLEERTRDNALFISAAAQWNSPTAERVMEWFTDKLYIRINKPSPMCSFSFASKEKDKILDYLRIADLGITDVQIEEKDITELDGFLELPEEVRKKLPDNAKAKRILFSHQGKSIVGEKIAVPFDFDLESTGTKAFFCYAGIWEEALSKGQVLVLDEFDAMLHPNLSRWLVKRFLNQKTNPNGAQLIITTHNPELMDPKLLRRDQIWFTMKNSSGASELYSLLEFKPRKEESFRRRYLQGSYGAVPILEDD